MDKTVYIVVLLFFVLVAAPVPSSRAADAIVQGQSAQAGDKVKKETPTAGKVQRASPASSAKQTSVKKQKNSLHAREWTFSEGSSRDTWQIQGMPANNLQGRAVGSPVPKDIAPGQVVNTSKSIDSALSQAEKSKKKGALALSVDDESSPWRESVTSSMSSDENLNMESRHVVRAYADTEVSEDMNIGLGPELILRNEQRERPSNNKQPDSVLGMGMQFKLDF
ncbi:MAG: hypothetical protein BCS36_09680 [Desulfovibrio sp. MES5]|uniref:hypothetical protein n=1 Tax=Desulfovibrio sp. MES5 TaxID=1899016 RepID=UPI000B9D09DA|nr:hypothetical protein [Desulfovibrio sp. MES5]OXS28382.1 MAG: hypothetical protein BCS36_09680 [Desulfovibrio sp. MES5]